MEEGKEEVKEEVKEEESEEVAIKFDPTKKKKKVTRPKKEKTEEENAEKPPEEGGEVEASNEPKDEDIPSDEEDVGEGTGDATYNELLERVFSLLYQNNSELVKLKKSKKLPITIPEVFRSPKKTIWHNFQATCKHMNRPGEHFQQYCLAELGTTGTLDGNNRLVMRGRFDPRKLESIQKSYIANYVTCGNCKMNNTVLKKENRLTVIQCQMCGSIRTVAAIRAGYVAQVTKRTQK